MCPACLLCSCSTWTLATSPPLMYVHKFEIYFHIFLYRSLLFHLSAPYLSSVYIYIYILLFRSMSLSIRITFLKCILESILNAPSSLTLSSSSCVGWRGCRLGSRRYYTHHLWNDMKFIFFSSPLFSSLPIFSLLFSLQLKSFILFLFQQECSL